MRFLITGGCGFVGSNLAAAVLDRGDQVTLFDDLSRHGSADNLQWLRGRGPVAFIHGDIRNAADVQLAVADSKPEAVLHLAGQVAMTTSVRNPRRDFEINVVGSFHLLEAVRRHAPEAPVVYSSSNKVYGDLPSVQLVEEEFRYSSPSHPRGIDETAPIDCHTPYGCSKGAADSYMLDYARTYGLNTVVFRHSTVFGGRQFATFDQGWVGWFSQQALLARRDPRREPFTISGDGKQVRDLLFVEDAVQCYLAAVANIHKARGNAFNIGGGIANSCSLLELFRFLERELAVELRYTKLPWRHSDQKFFVADCSKAAAFLDWTPRVSKEEGIRKLLAWLQTSAGAP
jgi:CDP-paratose 2-epimerase